MKKYSLLLIFMAVSFFAWASEPNGCYQRAENKTSASLRQTLTYLIDEYTEIYGLFYGSSSLRACSKIWDIYYTCNFPYQTNQ